MKTELAGLKEERARWDRRVAALRPESVDRELLEEEAHTKLDRVAKDEIVIFTAPGLRR